MRNTPLISLNLHAHVNFENKRNVQIKVTFRGKRKLYRSRYYLTQNEFDELRGKSGKAKKIFSKKERVEKNQELNDLLTWYQQVIDSIPTFTFAALEHELKRQEEKYGLELFHLLKKEEDLRKANDQISSSNQYRDARRSLTKTLGIKECLIIDVTPAFLYDYQDKALESGLSPTTIAMYMRVIKYVWNYCKDNNLIEPSLYPFGKKKPKYVMIKGKTRQKGLEVADMDVFKNYKFEVGKYNKGKRKQFYLDLFLFSYYTFGMNIVDVIKLKKSMFFNGFLDTQRTKTQVHQPSNLKIPIRPEAQKIIDKYQTDNSEFIFGILKGHETETQLKERTKRTVGEINDRLKEICHDKNIKKNVTTYTARHTAANQLLVADIPVAKIAQLLGHTDIKTTQDYLAKLPDYNIRDDVMGMAM